MFTIIIRVYNKKINALLKKNALILKSMGMNQKMLSQMNGNILWMYHGVAFLLMLVVVFGIGNWIPQVKALLIYYRFYHVIILFLLCALATAVTIEVLNRYLARLLKAGSEVRV